MNEIIEIRNRNLENFLFLHEIHAVKMSRDMDGMTVWYYEQEEETLRVIEEYKEIQKKRRARLHRSYNDSLSE